MNKQTVADFLKKNIAQLPALNNQVVFYFSGGDKITNLGIKTVVCSDAIRKEEKLRTLRAIETCSRCICKS